MADLTKIKRRNSLGAPPSPDEASQNLTAPEIAPSSVEQAPSAHAAGAPPAAPARQPNDLANPPVDPERLDGRTMRRTGRTFQLATRVSWEFDAKLRRIAQREHLKLVEVLERALDAYERASQ